MSSGFATVTDEDGVLVRSACVNGFTLAELRFPPGYVQREFEPDLPYLACVLDGRLEKSFRLHTIQLDAACAVIIPSGETHGARFGSKGARIVIVKPGGPANGAGICLDRLAELRGRGLSWLAWRLAAELRASDAAARLPPRGWRSSCSQRPAARRDPSAGPARLRRGCARPKRYCARGSGIASA